MVLNDYYNGKELENEYQNFKRTISAISGCPVSMPDTTHISRIIRFGRMTRLEKHYKINRKACIYELLVEYATHISEVFNDYYLNHPLIYRADLKGESKNVETEYGNIPFSLFVPNRRYVLSKFPDIDLMKKSYAIFKGRALGKCHLFSLSILNPKLHCVTAFLPDMIDCFEIVHSYIENPKQHKIYDISRNLVFDKDVFEDLLQPKIISDIPMKQYLDDVSKISESNLNVGVKEYLVEHDKVMKLVKN